MKDKRQQQLENMNSLKTASKTITKPCDRFFDGRGDDRATNLIKNEAYDCDTVNTTTNPVAV